MSRPPQSPYPPDPADGAPLEVELEELVNAALFATVLGVEIVD